MALPPLTPEQRAAALLKAADFEKTLGERREHAAQEFNAEMAKQDEALAGMQERVDALSREADLDREAKVAESQRILEAAREEATGLVRTAREQADRIRRDSERELAAATARRDSITAQLSNVRNMLATLGGASAVGVAVEEPAAAETLVEEVTEVEATEAHEADGGEADLETEVAEATQG